MDKTNPPAKAPSARGFGPWAKAHKLELILGGGGLVVAYALYEKSHASSSTAASSTSGNSTSSSSPAQDVLYPGSASTSGELTSLSQQLDQLQQQVSGITAGNPSTTGAPGPAAPALPLVRMGSGFGEQSSGPYQVDGWTHVTNPSEQEQLVAAGYQTDYMIAPGTFVPTEGAKVAPGTPTFFNGVKRAVAKVTGK